MKKIAAEAKSWNNQFSQHADCDATNPPNTLEIHVLNQLIGYGGANKIKKIGFISKMQVILFAVVLLNSTAISTRNLARRLQ